MNENEGKQYKYDKNVSVRVQNFESSFKVLYFKCIQKVHIQNCKHEEEEDDMIVFSNIQKLKFCGEKSSSFFSCCFESIDELTFKETKCVPAITRKIGHKNWP